MLMVPFVDGQLLLTISQTSEDKVFAWKDIDICLSSGIYEELYVTYVKQLIDRGNMVSSAFVVWSGEGMEPQGGFVINFHGQSTH